MKEIEKEFVKERKVVCSGQGNSLGHPTVYLKIAKNQTEIACPYCSKKFVLDLKK